MSTYQTELVTAPSALHESIDQSQLQVRGLTVVQGLSATLAERLVASSREPHVAAYCPNDVSGRFHDVEAVAAWQRKGRLSLPLVRKTGSGKLELAGFGWMGPGVPGEGEPSIVGATTTFAVRLYRNALGQGNAVPYTRAILEAHAALYGNSGVWLEAWGDNTPALRSYERIGFERVAEVVAARQGERTTRVYMTLGNLATE